MTLPLFPTPIGLGWSATTQFRFKSRIQNAVSGREMRLLDQPYPIRVWTLNFEFLRDQWDRRGGVGLGAGYDELRTIVGFYTACQGAFRSFLFDDPSDNQVESQQIGTGDGTTTQFQLIRTLPYLFNEPITAPRDVQGVFLDGAFLEPGSYTWSAETGVMTITPAPDASVAITVDFTYYFRCRFADDSAEFENFMYQLWALKQIKIQSVLL